MREDFKHTANTRGHTEIATLAGGCFWGVEELFRSLDGVLKTQVGYIGGHTSNPVYPDVKTGRTGHAEAIQVLFDSSKITYLQILEFFFRMHDPTTLNRQGGDVGSQYRSAIFIYTAKQRSEAEHAIALESQRGRWSAPIVTEIVEAPVFGLPKTIIKTTFKKTLTATCVTLCEIDRLTGAR